jgi:metallo-beta-lactamase class B
MTTSLLMAAAVLGMPVLATAATAVVADPPNNCDWCAQANAPREPFRVWGDTFYVGTQGLSSILLTSDKGHILIDGALPQSAPLIAANIEKLGFKLADVKLILNSHTHYDHAGGVAALQRATGAQIAASPEARLALERGGPTQDDPQFAFGPAHNDFAAVRNVRTVRDGETLRVGPLAVTAHFTPGHTPGGTSWSWRVCERADCVTVAYVDSLNPVSAPGFRFSGDATHPSRVENFRKSMDTVAGLECDIALAPHPDLVDIDGRLRAAKTAGKDHLEPNRGGCKAYAEMARGRLDKRLAEENPAP